MIQEALQQVMIPSNTNLNDVVVLIQGMNGMKLDIVFHQSELPPLEIQKKHEAFNIIVQVNRIAIKQTLLIMVRP